MNNPRHRPAVRWFEFSFRIASTLRSTMRDEPVTPWAYTLIRYRTMLADLRLGTHRIPGSFSDSYSKYFTGPSSSRIRTTSPELESHGKARIEIISMGR